MAVKNSKMLFSEEESGEKPVFLVQEGISHSPKDSKCCRSCSNLRYRWVKIPENGGIFMVVFNLFFMMAIATSFQNITFEPLNINTKLLTIPSLLPLFLCPVLGLLSECYLRKYKIFQASIYCLFFELVLSAVSIITNSAYISYVALVALCSSIACYALCVGPFTMDQIVGASGEELSFTIYWIIWPFFPSYGVLILLECTKSQYMHIALFILSVLSFIVSILLVLCYRHVLVTKSQLSNPVKLILKVLNYARKHKFPERRSAFTYWEDECPSRIDLGKHKYGGPFTVEEVEDVKTTLKLLLLLSSVMPIIALEFATQAEVRHIGCHASDPLFWLTFLWPFIATSSLPIYHFIVYPFFYNYIPSMLKRIGLGMLVTVLFKTVISIAEFYAMQKVHDKQLNITFSCYDSDTEKFFILPWLIAASHPVTKIGIAIATVSALEFVMAQTPCQLRGFVTSLSIGLQLIFFEIGVIYYQSIPNHCTAVLGIPVITFVAFILYVIVSRWYKLRERNKAIPYHIFAENQFESDHRQKQMYESDNHGWSDTDSEKTSSD